MTWVDIAFSTYMEPAPYKTLVDVDLDLSSYPHIRALIAKVKSNRKIARWIKRRPVTNV